MVMAGTLLGAAASLEREWRDKVTAGRDCGIVLEDAIGVTIGEVSKALASVTTPTVETFFDLAAAELAGMAVGGPLVLSGRRGGGTIVAKSRVWPIQMSGLPEEAVAEAIRGVGGASKPIWNACFW